MKSAIANVQRLEQLTGFEKIYAPFDGTITARNVDIGTLINSGTARELFHLSQENVLRVYVNVPQIYSLACVPGVGATLTLAEFPGKRFEGKIVRTAKAIDPASRTLLVEVDVKNRYRGAVSRGLRGGSLQAEGHAAHAGSAGVNADIPI